MRSGALRVTFGAVAWIVVAAAVAFLFRSEQQIAERRGAVRQFDQQTRETASLISDLRAAQQAYVAAGQGLTYWVPKVTANIQRARANIGTLETVAASSDAREALRRADGSIGEFLEADTRARDYLKAGQTLMGADVVFTEGSDAVTTAARQVDAAQVAEHLALDSWEASLRKREAAAAGAAALICLLVVLLLVPGGHAKRTEQTDMEPAVALEASARDALSIAHGLSLREPAHAHDAAPPRDAPPPPDTSAVLLQAAQLCTALGRVATLDDLRLLLGSAAGMMDARGLIVWVGGSHGEDLRPMLSHGYSPQAMARMPTIPRTADNAAAAAYRTAAVQIVPASASGAPGAIVAPIITMDGCIGALSAEVRGGGETSATMQALASLFAAQLAAVVAAAPDAAQPASERATATGG